MPIINITLYIMSTDIRPRCSWGTACKKQDDADHTKKFSHSKSPVMCKDLKTSEGCTNPNCLYSHSTCPQKNIKITKSAKVFDSASVSDSDSAEKPKSKSKHTKIARSAESYEKEIAALKAENDSLKKKISNTQKILSDHARA